MPKVDQQNTTSATKRSVTPATPATPTREAAVGATVSPHAWRHPAEPALAEIAEDLGGGIEVMASLDGALDVTMTGSYRIEVRDFGICLVPLARPAKRGDAPGRSWLSHEGAEAMVRLLGAIQASATDSADRQPAT